MLNLLISEWVTTAGSPTQLFRVNNVKCIDFRATTAGSPTQYINNVKCIDFRADYSRFSHSVAKDLTMLNAIDFRATTAGSPTQHINNVK